MSVKNSLPGSYFIYVTTGVTIEQTGDNEYFILSQLPDNVPLKINNSAAIIWEQCKHEASIDALVQNICSAVDIVNEQTVQSDIHSVLRFFETHRLVHFRPKSRNDYLKYEKSLRGRVDPGFSLISHRRSGTHFLWELMRLNFATGVKADASLWDIPKSHKQWSTNACVKLSEHRTRTIYIYRDGRDVAVANYNYWKSGGERTGVAESVRQTSFADFLRGGVVIDTVHPARKAFVREYFSDPIGYWVQHTQWADHIYSVKFEEIVQDPVRVLSNVANHFNLDFAESTFTATQGLVGHMPRKGEAGNWTSWFSSDDEQYFNNIANQRMVELGYA